MEKNMHPTEIESQYSETGDNNESLVDGLAGSYAESHQLLVSNGMINLEEESAEYELVKKGFLKGMGFMGHVTTVMGVHKNMVSFSLKRQARSDSFKIFSNAVAIKCGGDANVRHAWYGGSLDELREIVTFGFSFNQCKNNNEDESHGVGICLFSANFSIDGAMSTVADEDGLRHVLLCRVILGKVEEVPAGSKQSQPSSKQHDSAVDDLFAPIRHIIWTPFMNSHIQPDYIVSFKYTCLTGPHVPWGPKPRSQYVLFPNLLASVSKHLGPSQMSSLLQTYRDYKEQKIPRELWTKKVRVIVGDRLLVSVIANSSGNALLL